MAGQVWGSTAGESKAEYTLFLHGVQPLVALFPCNYFNNSYRLPLGTPFAGHASWLVFLVSIFARYTQLSIERGI